MSLLGRGKCKAEAKSSLPRWEIHRLWNRKGAYMGAHCHGEGRHATKELAIAEMSARLPRLAKGEALLLWDDECEEWVDWDPAA